MAAEFLKLDLGLRQILRTPKRVLEVSLPPCMARETSPLRVLQTSRAGRAMGGKETSSTRLGCVESAGGQDRASGIQRHVELNLRDAKRIQVSRERCGHHGRCAYLSCRAVGFATGPLASVLSSTRFV